MALNFHFILLTSHIFLINLPHLKKEEISKNIRLLSEKDEEVKEAIQKMEGQEEVNIDEAVVTTTPLYRQ